MNIKETQLRQAESLQNLCNKNNINFNVLGQLLDSAKTKKLFKRNNYHQQKINDVIEKIIK